MIKKWLFEQERDSAPQFRIIDLSEQSNQPDTEVRKFLTLQLIIHLISPNQLKKLFQGRPINEIVEYITANVFPRNDDKFNVRQSTWGEVVTASIVERLRSFKLPIKKLRYKEAQSKAMRGKADCIAASIKDGKLLVCFAEAKTKIQYHSGNDRDIAKDAYDALAENINLRPEIIDYIARRLEHDDEYALADLFNKAILEPTSYDRHFQIFLIFEKKVWNEEIIDFLKSQTLALPNLIVNVVLIDSLKELIDLSYNLTEQIAEQALNG